ncbi:MAG: hypothetical protein M3Z54_06440 [Gemmatimonadota bacterium]|nr:hypothetical protein [Gemmatimonadota bacterium]
MARRPFPFARKSTELAARAAGFTEYCKQARVAAFATAASTTFSPIIIPCTTAHHPMTMEISMTTPGRGKQSLTRRRVASSLLLIAVCACGGDGAVGRTATTTPLDHHRSALIGDSVRVFAAALANDLSARGMEAWSEHLVLTPRFFMAAGGRMIFPTGDSARRGLVSVRRAISRMNFEWEGPVRVEPLAPGLAIMGAPYRELRTDTSGRNVDERGFMTAVVSHVGPEWRLLDAHWSTIPEPDSEPRHGGGSSRQEPLMRSSILKDVSKYPRLVVIDLWT